MAILPKIFIPQPRPYAPPRMGNVPQDYTQEGTPGIVLPFEQAVPRVRGGERDAGPGVTAPDTPIQYPGGGGGGNKIQPPIILPPYEPPYQPSITPAPPQSTNLPKISPIEMLKLVQSANIPSTYTLESVSDGIAVYRDQYGNRQVRAAPSEFKWGLGGKTTFPKATEIKTIPTTKYDIQLKPYLKQDIQDIITDPDTGKQIPIYGNVIYVDPTVMGKQAERLATPEEKDYYTQQVKLEQSKGRISNIVPAPKIIRTVRETYGSAKQLGRGFMQSVEEQNIQGAEFLKGIGVTDTNIEKAGTFISSRFGAALKPSAQEVLRGAVTEVTRDIRDRPITQGVPLVVGGTLGFGVEAAPMVVRGVTSWIPKVGKYIPSAVKIGLVGGGLYMGGKYALDVGSRVIAAPTPYEKGETIGLAAKDTILFGVGYSKGTRLAKSTEGWLATLGREDITGGGGGGGGGIILGENYPKAPPGTQLNKFQNNFIEGISYDKLNKDVLAAEYSRFNLNQQLAQREASKYPLQHAYPHLKEVAFNMQKIIDAYPEFHDYLIKEYGSLAKAKEQASLAAMAHDNLKVGSSSAETPFGGGHGEDFFKLWKSGLAPSELQNIAPKFAEAIKSHEITDVPKGTIEWLLLSTADRLQFSRFKQGVDVSKLPLPDAIERVQKIEGKIKYVEPKITPAKGEVMVKQPIYSTGGLGLTPSGSAMLGSIKGFGKALSEPFGVLGRAGKETFIKPALEFGRKITEPFGVLGRAVKLTAGERARLTAQPFIGIGESLGVLGRSVKPTAIRYRNIWGNEVIGFVNRNLKGGPEWGLLGKYSPEQLRIRNMQSAIRNARFTLTDIGNIDPITGYKLAKRQVKQIGIAVGRKFTGGDEWGLLGKYSPEQLRIRNMQSAIRNARFTLTEGTPQQGAALVKRGLGQLGTGISKGVSRPFIRAGKFIKGKANYVYDITSGRLVSMSQAGKRFGLAVTEPIGVLGRAVKLTTKQKVIDPITGRAVSIGRDIGTVGKGIGESLGVLGRTVKLTARERAKQITTFGRVKFVEPTARFGGKVSKRIGSLGADIGVVGKSIGESLAVLGRAGKETTKPYIMPSVRLLKEGMPIRVKKAGELISPAEFAGKFLDKYKIGGGKITLKGAKPVAISATSDKFWKSKLGETIQPSAEKSKAEIAGIYASTFLSTEFLGLNKPYSEAPLFNLRAILQTGKPAAVVLKPKAFREVQVAFSSEPQFPTQRKTPRGYVVWTKPAELGVMDIPKVGKRELKTEIEALARPEAGGYSITGTKYYVKVYGVRVPVDIAEATAIKIKAELKATGKSKTLEEIKRSEAPQLSKIREGIGVSSRIERIPSSSLIVPSLPSSSIVSSGKETVPSSSRVSEPLSSVTRIPSRSISVVSSAVSIASPSYTPYRYQKKTPYPPYEPSKYPAYQPPIKSKSKKKKYYGKKLTSTPKGYLVFTYQRKKPMLISQKPLIKSEAIGLGVRVTKGTARATFKLVPTTRAPVPSTIRPIREQEVWKMGYRRPIRKGKPLLTTGVFIQRRPTRMGTRKETLSIQQYRRGKSIW